LEGIKFLTSNSPTLNKGRCRFAVGEHCAKAVMTSENSPKP